MNMKAAELFGRSEWFDCFFVYAMQNNSTGRGAPLPVRFLSDAAAQPFSRPTCWATMLAPLYLARSLGFSIFPVGFRGTLSKMISRGRL